MCHEVGSFVSEGVTDKWSVVQGSTLVQPVAIYSLSPVITGFLMADAALGWGRSGGVDWTLRTNRRKGKKL
ncbi:hypothetical protein C1Y35_30415 [Pseudomonas sp. GW456-L14]|nr:hypothetical protein C1Y35_30415 [Pseudomonas sp. GW456-L14]PMY48555.1 hypothetical protein C1Y34_30100 [Pseudomonas sp. GW456-L12]